MVYFDNVLVLEHLSLEDAINNVQTLTLPGRVDVPGRRHLDGSANLPVLQRHTIANDIDLLAWRR